MHATGIPAGLIGLKPFSLKKNGNLEMHRSSGKMDSVVDRNALAMVFFVRIYEKL